MSEVNTQRVRTISGKVRICSTNIAIGTFWVDEDGRDVTDAQFVECLKTGKIIPDVEGGVDAMPPAKPREELIANAVNMVIARGNTEDFTAVGNKPKVAVVQAESGVDDVKAAEIEDAVANLGAPSE